MDQNFNEHIVDGMTRRDPNIEFTHVRDVGLAAASDPEVLEWAAQRGMVLLSHDRKTMPSFAADRVAAGEAMPGVFIVSANMMIGQAVGELLVAALCLSSDECRDIVKYFPI